MKYFFLILFTGLACVSRAQTPVPAQLPPAPIQTSYGVLQFDKHFYDVENHWVVATKIPNNGKYVFGMVYLDMQAGFSFRSEGTFNVDAQGHVYRDSVDYPKNNIMIARIGANANPQLAAIPDAMLNDLHVKPVPDWLAAYHPANQDRNSVAFKVAYGRHLNSSGAAAKAVTYLEEAYKTEPHAAGVEYELAYAYNIIGQYDKAIEILKAAKANAPDNPVFYTELAFAYMRKKDYANSVETFKAALPLAKRDAVTKTTITTNLSLIYCELQQYDKAHALISDFIADNPNNITAYILEATVYTKENDFDGVIKSYSKAIDVTPPQNMENKAELALTVAVIYRDKKNDHDQFVSWAQKARAWAPVNGRAALSLKQLGF